MVRKAKLDQFDAPEIDPIVTPPSEEGPEEATEQAEAVTWPKRLAGLLSLFSSLRRVPRKMVMIYLAACIIAVVIIAVVGVFTFSGDTPPLKAASSVSVPRLTDTVYLKNFVIDCIDSRNTLRVVSCDVAVILRERCDISRLEGDPRIRETIYRVAKQNGAGQLAAAVNRNRVKREMEESLNQLLGGNIVRFVYFTKLVIL
jgi:flagellar basal body-associated protein FliL